MANEKKQYTVHSSLHHDKHYKKDDIVHLTDAEAEPLVKVGVVALHESKSAQTPQTQTPPQQPAIAGAQEPVKSFAEMSRAEKLVYAREALKLTVANNISNDELAAKVAEAEAKAAK